MICTVQLLLPRGSGRKPNRFASPSRISSFDSSVYSSSSVVLLCGDGCEVALGIETRSQVKGLATEVQPREDHPFEAQLEACTGKTANVKWPVLDCWTN